MTKISPSHSEGGKKEEGNIGLNVSCIQFLLEKDIYLGSF